MRFQSRIAWPRPFLAALSLGFVALSASPGWATGPQDIPLPGAGEPGGTTPPQATDPRYGPPLSTDPDDIGPPGTTGPPAATGPQDIPPPNERGARPRQGQQQQPPPPREKADAIPASPEQREKLLTQLYKNLAATSSSSEAESIAQSIEKLWAVSGSATADLLADRALNAAHAGERDLALKLLDSTVELQPDFAEAWNRRAFVYYLNNDYKRALGDLRRVLALDPNHFKALDGLARMLRDIGEKKASYEAFQRLLKVYPYAPGAKEAIQELKTEVEGQGI